MQYIEKCLIRNNKDARKMGDLLLGPLRKR